MHRLLLLTLLPGLALGAPSEEAKRVLEGLRGLPARTPPRLLSGQAVGHGPEVTEGYTTWVVNLHRDTGAWVGVVGADYALGSLDEKWLAQVNAIATQHWNAGGLVTLCACSLNNPATGGDRGDLSFRDLKALITPGTDANAKWLAVLDRLASALAVLRDAGVVVLWRPLHEMNLPASSWWADAPPADFIALWRHLHAYFTVTKGLDNLLWVYAPNGVPYDNGTKPPMDYYPGDDVVDVVGLDWYADEPAKLAAGGYDALLATGKPFGFTEFGPDIAKSFTAHDLPTMLEGLKANAPKAAFFWHWQSYGGRKMALVDLQNAKAGLADATVMNCGDLDFPTADGGARGKCAALDALPPSTPKGCGCQSSGALTAMLGLLGVAARRGRGRRAQPAR